MKTTYFCISFLLTTHIINAKVIELTSQQEIEDIILTPQKKAVIKFSATWCPPCQRIKEPYKVLSEKEDFKDVIFATVDVDKSESLAEKYHIRSMPSFIYIVDNQIKKDEGAPDNLEQRIKKKLKLTELPTATTKSISIAEEEPAQAAIEPKEEPTIEQTFLETIQTRLNNFWKWITNSITNLFPGR